jgi:hypothetical protein
MASKDERARAARVHGDDVLALRKETRLVHPVRDPKGLGVIGDGDALAADRRCGLGHLFDRRAAVGLVGVHLMIRAGNGAPLGMCLHHGPRVREADEAIAERRGLRGIWLVA